MHTKTISQNTVLLNSQFLKNGVILFFITLVFLALFSQFNLIKLAKSLQVAQAAIITEFQPAIRVQYINDPSAYIANRKRDGHFHIKTRLPYSNVTMLVDTGATYITLKHEDAQEAGLLSNVRYNSKVITANGSANFGRVTLDEIIIGNFKLRNVKALIAPPGALDVSLLGMSALSKIPQITMKNNQLILSK